MHPASVCASMRACVRTNVRVSGVSVGAGRHKYCIAHSLTHLRVTQRYNISNNDMSAQARSN